MDDKELTDEAAVALARVQKEFFGILVERYEARLTRYVRRLGVRNDDDIADVLQNVFLKVYRNLNDFDTTLSFSSWIYRITHNETISYFRKQNVRPEGHLVDDGETILSLKQSDEWGSDELFDKALDAKRVNEVLESLDEKYRDVIILRFFEHKDYDEISDILKIPTGTVGTLLYRAKKQIESRLNDNKMTYA